uniref:ATP synthase complex subunit 8 n=1 Tax=Sipalinus gigas TaxID=1078824 RepID=A0A7H1DNQ8_9CUCU|nr:ATP synthase F0 subunit 8 [Sipalinus gigas]QNS38616.1 ATP synthase F0 subunit 8 [Sipalinus gigas]
MPQMAPLSWLILYFFFILIFFMFNAVNYFTFLYKPNKPAPSPKKIKLNWKW